MIGGLVVSGIGFRGGERVLRFLVVPFWAGERERVRCLSERKGTLFSSLNPESVSFHFLLRANNAERFGNWVSAKCNIPFLIR